MPRLEKERFGLLEEVKTVNIGNEMAVTLSIGIGMNGDSTARIMNMPGRPLTWPWDGRRPGSGQGF